MFFLCEKGLTCSPSLALSVGSGEVSFAVLSVEDTVKASATTAFEQTHGVSTCNDTCSLTGALNKEDARMRCKGFFTLQGAILPSWTPSIVNVTRWFTVGFTGTYPTAMTRLTLPVTGVC